MLIMKVQNKLRANSEKNKRFFFNIHDFDLLMNLRRSKNEEYMFIMQAEKRLRAEIKGFIPNFEKRK